MHHLQEQRQVGQRAEHREAGREADRGGDGEDRVLEQPQRQDGLGGVAGGEVPGEQQQRGQGEQPDDHRRGPGVRGAAPGGREHDRGGEPGERGRAEVVDLVVLPGAGRGEHHGDHDKRDRADRQVDVEHPAPAEVVDEEPADQRADDGRDAEDRAERALVLAALPRRHDVADDRLGQYQQAAAADALDRAEGDELAHVPRLAAQGRADQEDHDRAEEEVLAAVLIAELAPDLRGRGRGEQVRGHDPGQVRKAAEVVDDRRQRGGDDRLVERGEQQREHERAVDDQQLLAVLLGPWRVTGRPCRRPRFRRPGRRHRPCRRRRDARRGRRFPWCRHTGLIPRQQRGQLTPGGQPGARRRWSSAETTPKQCRNGGDVRFRW